MSVYDTIREGIASDRRKAQDYDNLQRENEELREQVKSAKYCLYFLLQQHGGEMRISKHDISAIHPDEAIVQRECLQTGDQVFRVQHARTRDSDAAKS